MEEKHKTGNCAISAWSVMQNLTLSRVVQSYASRHVATGQSFRPSGLGNHGGPSEKQVMDRSVGAAGLIQLRRSSSMRSVLFNSPAESSRFDSATFVSKLKLYGTLYGIQAPGNRLGSWKSLSL